MPKRQPCMKCGRGVLCEDYNPGLTDCPCCEPFEPTSFTCTISGLESVPCRSIPLSTLDQWLDAVELIEEQISGPDTEFDLKQKVAVAQSLCRQLKAWLERAKGGGG